MRLIQVLIIEDNERILKLHRLFLEKVDGFELVGIAKSLKEAEETIAVLQPDLILLDLFFPDGHGMSFLKQMRMQDINFDVILITADKDVNSLQDALRNGAFDYIVKPVVFDRFKESLEKYKTFKTGISAKQTIEQKDADSIFMSAQQVEYTDDDVPKGIDPLTLKKVKDTLVEYGERGICAQETGKLIGASRITARRYLEYLVSGGFISADITYGSVGRPERKYFYKPEKN